MPWTDAYVNLLFLPARAPYAVPFDLTEARSLERHLWPVPRRFTVRRWDAARYGLVVAGNLAKFGRHADLRDFLLATGDRVLVEASPYDRVWGIGMAVTNAGVRRPSAWRGRNLLGFALMDVRERL